MSKEMLSMSENYVKSVIIDDEAWIWAYDQATA